MSNRPRAVPTSFETSPGAPYVRVAVRVVGFLALFWLFDRATPVAGPDTPPAWYLPVGLASAFVLSHGPAWAPLVVVATLLTLPGSEALNQAHWGWAALALAAGPAMAAWAARNPLGIEPTRPSIRNTLWLLLLAVAVPVITAWGTARHGVWPDISAAWRAHLLGLLTVCPLWLAHVQPAMRRALREEPGPILPRFWERIDPERAAEMASQAATLAICIFVAFRQRGAGDPQLLFLVFPPMLWIALRHGLPGAAVATAAINVAGVVLTAPGDTLGVTQVLMTIQSFTGLALGAAVADSRRSVREQRASEERYRQLVEQASDGIFITDSEGWFVDVNTRGCHMLGFTRAQVLRRHLRDTMLPEDVGDLPGQLGELRSGRFLVTERLLVRKDGTTIPVEISASMLSSGRFLGIYRDLTDRRAQETRLRLLAAAIDATDEGVVIAAAAYDPTEDSLPGSDFTLVFANRGLLKMTGHLPEDLLGVSPDQLLTSASGDAELTRLYRCLDRGEPWSGDTTVLRANGTTFPAYVAFAPVRDGSGFITHFVGLLRDFTAVRSLEEQLRHSQRMEAVGRLAGGVAHDFNNLLTVITGYGELLLSMLEEDHPHHRIVSQIQEAGERAADLTRQLLMFSRKQVVQPRLLDLNEVTAGLHELMDRMIGERVELVTELMAIRAAVRADQGHLQQVLMNLAVNAREAMPQGGRVTVRTSNAVLGAADARGVVGLEPGAFVLLEVEDTGVGIAPEVQRRMFEPFFTTKEQGTGLGLSTVYGIVKQAGGHVTVQSELGVGTTFRIFLPLAEGHAESAPTRAAPARTSGRGTVLLVEDERMVRELAAAALEQAGYRVLAAADGEEAQEVAASIDAVDILVTDVIMPGMTGPELARALTARSPSLRVLFMSGYTADAFAGMELPDDASRGFLPKPFTPVDLTTRVREVLEAGSPPPAGAMILR